MHDLATLLLYLRYHINWKLLPKTQVQIKLDDVIVFGDDRKLKDVIAKYCTRVQDIIDRKSSSCTKGLNSMLGKHMAGYVKDEGLEQNFRIQWGLESLDRSTSVIVRVNVVACELPPQLSNGL